MTAIPLIQPKTKPKTVAEQIHKELEKDTDRPDLIILPLEMYGQFVDEKPDAWLDFFFKDRILGADVKDIAFGYSNRHTPFRHKLEDALLFIVRSPIEIVMYTFMGLGVWVFVAISEQPGILNIILDALEK